MLLLSGVWLHALIDGCDQQQRHAHTLKSLHLELDNSTFRIWLLRISPHSDAFSDASQKGHVVKHVWENLAEAENLAESLGKSGPRAARAPMVAMPNCRASIHQLASIPKTLRMVGAPCRLNSLEIHRCSPSPRKPSEGGEI